MKTQIKLMQVKKHGILKTLLLKITGKYPAYKNVLMDAENVDTVQLIGKDILNGVYKGNGVYEFDVKVLPQRVLFPMGEEISEIKTVQYTLHVNGIEQSDWSNIYICEDVKI